MTTLEDYLGNITSGLNQARALADQESAKIARLYAKDELLKHFSVPRFRAKNIELTIPVALKEPITIDKKNLEAYEPIDNVRFNSAIYVATKEALKLSSFQRKVSNKIQNTIASFSRNIEKDIKAEGDNNENIKKNINKLSKSIAEHIFSEETTKKEMEEKKWTQKSIANDLSGRLNTDVINLIQPKLPISDKKLAGLEIIAEAHKLKEVDQNALIQIKMTLSEEGMEWHTMEGQEGELKTKLLPE